MSIYTVIDSCDFTVIDRYDFTVIDRYDFTVIGCYDFTVADCCDFTVIGCCDFTVIGCYDFTVIGCYDFTVADCCDFTVIGCCDFTVIGCCDFTVIGCCDFTVIDCYVYTGSLPQHTIGTATTPNHCRRVASTVESVCVRTKLSPKWLGQLAVSWRTQTRRSHENGRGCHRPSANHSLKLTKPEQSVITFFIYIQTLLSSKPLMCLYSLHIQLQNQSVFM